MSGADDLAYGNNVGFPGITYSHIPAQPIPPGLVSIFNGLATPPFFYRSTSDEEHGIARYHKSQTTPSQYTS